MILLHCIIAILATCCIGSMAIPGPDADNAAPGTNDGSVVPGPNADNAVPGTDAGESSPGPNADNAVPGPNAGKAVPGPDAGKAVPVPNAGYGSRVGHFEDLASDTDGDLDENGDPWEKPYVLFNWDHLDEATEIKVNWDGKVITGRLVTAIDLFHYFDAIPFTDDMFEEAAPPGDEGAAATEEAPKGAEGAAADVVAAPGEDPVVPTDTSAGANTASTGSTSTTTPSAVTKAKRYERESTLVKLAPWAAETGRGEPAEVHMPSQLHEDGTILRNGGFNPEWWQPTCVRDGTTFKGPICYQYDPEAKKTEVDKHFVSVPQKDYEMGNDISVEIGGETHPAKYIKYALEVPDN